MARRTRVPALALAAILLSVVAPIVPAGAAGGLVVTDLDNGTTVAGLAQQLAGAGVSIANVTYTGSTNAAGAFDGGSGIIGFDSGIVLGSGSVQTTEDHPAPCAKGVEGPNECAGNGTENGTGGDDDLGALSGVGTADAAVLEFDFTPAADTVHFSYVFSSDEYPDFANSEFNDAFGFFVNGVNCALVPGTSLPVSINTINGGNPIGENPQHPEFYVDNDFVAEGTSAVDVEMDGLTTVLACDASVNAGVTNHMKLAIADGSDDALDSNVFIEAGSLVSGTQISTSLSDGDQSGPSITVPGSTGVTDAATLTGDNISTAGGSVHYFVYGDSACTDLVDDTGTKTVNNGVVPDSDVFIAPGPGTYYWQAVYSGDADNTGVTSPCGDEVLTVTGEPADLQIGATLIPSSVSDGAVGDWQLDVSNNLSESTLTGVSLHVTIDAGSLNVAGTNSGSPGGSCKSVHPVHGVVTEMACNLGDIAGSDHVVVNALIDTSKGGSGSPIHAHAEAISASPVENATADDALTVTPATPGTVSGFVVPGGTITTAKKASAADPVIIAVTLPKRVAAGSINPALLGKPNAAVVAPKLVLSPGAALTVSEESAAGNPFCGGEPCTGGIVLVTPFEHYNDPLHPVKIKVTWFKGVLPAVSHPFKQTVDGGPGSEVLPCAKKASERTFPCLLKHTGKSIKANQSDTILALSGDPRFARR